MNFNFITLTKLKHRRIWIFTASLGVLLLLIFNRYHAHQLPQSEGVWVEASKAKIGNIPVEVRAVGTLVAENQIEHHGKGYARQHR